MQQTRISNHLARTLTASVLLCIGLAACSKEEQKPGSASAPQASAERAAAPAGQAPAAQAAKTAAADVSKTLLEVTPKDTFAFVVFEAKSPSYAKYKASPWGSSKNNWSEMLKGASGEAKSAAEMMKRLGFDLDDPKAFDHILSETVFFAAPPVSGEKKPAAGIVFRPDSSFKAADFIANVKKEVSAQGGSLKVEDATIAGGTGLRFVDSSDGGAASNQMKEFFLGQKGGLAVVATSLKAVEGVLNASGGSLPELVAGANYQKASAGFPSATDRFATAFFDVDKFASVAERFGEPELSAKLKSAPIPVKAVAMAFAMESAPRTDVRMIYDESNPNSKEWLSTLGSSPSASVLAALPAKPLFFLSIDGQTIQKAKEKALAAAGPQAAMYKSQLAMLDGITRIGIAAKAAAPGQSMLPLPELLIVAETKEPAKLSTAIEGLVGPAVAGGMPGMEWKTTTEGAVSVRSMQSPMGVGAYLAGTKNLLVVASTDSQMKSALANLAGTGTGFAKGLSSSAEQVLVKEPTVGNLYVNFEEVASALESVGGMISMFAPQGGEAAQQYLSPENIAALRKMGSVVGEITLDAGAINIKSFYQGA